MSTLQIFCWVLFATTITLISFSPDVKAQYYGQYITSDNDIPMQIGEWVTSSTNSHFYTLQSDGNFCLYGGTSPSNNTGYVWCNFNYGHTVGDYFEVNIVGNGKTYEGQIHGSNPEFEIWGCAYPYIYDESYRLIIEETPTKAYVSIWSAQHPLFRCST